MAWRPFRSRASGIISPQPDDPPGYCLDANLSYKVASALARVDHRVMHVCELPGNTATVQGQCNIPDEDIARWCATQRWVLITCDEDFRGRWVRSGLLERHGVEVIVFDRELSGLQEQHRRITAHLFHWDQVLGALPREHRVWEQGARYRPNLMRRRPRSRG